MDRLTPQEQAERLRLMQEDDSLRKLQRDLKLRGVGFSWERVRGRLIGKLKGREVQDIAFQASSWAMTMLATYYPSAVIEQGGVLKDKRTWVAIVWLDAPEAEARKREEQHEHLEPTPLEEPGVRRCPHDGARCKGKPSTLVGAPPHLCETGRCLRERNGVSLRRAYDGYPLAGHEFPARRKGEK